MKAYSVELREKIVQAYENHEGSQRQLASRFRVSLSFIERILKRYREQQTLELLPHAGGFETKLAEYKSAIALIVDSDNDATLDELCQKLNEKYRVQVSSSTMCRLLRKLNLTRKKNRFTQRKLKV
ncbi:MAG: transposase [Heteroscytonema crispum UTEX LB 1556]